MTSQHPRSLNNSTVQQMYMVLFPNLFLKQIHLNFKLLYYEEKVEKLYTSYISSNFTIFMFSDTILKAKAYSWQNIHPETNHLHEGHCRLSTVYTTFLFLHVKCCAVWSTTTKTSSWKQASLWAQTSLKHNRREKILPLNRLLLHMKHRQPSDTNRCFKSLQVIRLSSSQHWQLIYRNAESTHRMTDGEINIVCNATDNNRIPEPFNSPMLCAGVEWGGRMCVEEEGSVTIPRMWQQRECELWSKSVVRTRECHKRWLMRECSTCGKNKGIWRGRKNVES